MELQERGQDDWKKETMKRGDKKGDSDQHAGKRDNVHMNLTEKWESEE